MTGLPGEYLVTTDHLGVVPYGPQHVEALATWMSADAFDLFLTSSSLTFPVTAKALEEYHRASTAPPGTHEFLEVYHRQSGQHIGHFEIKAISRRYRTGTLAHVLLGAKEFRGKGLGKELCDLMVRYGFECRDLYRLSASVHVCNRPAVAAYVMGGFVLEGVVRDVVEFHGKRYSLYQMSILKPEWQRGA